MSANIEAQGPPRSAATTQQIVLIHPQRLVLHRIALVISSRWDGCVCRKAATAEEALGLIRGLEQRKRVVALVSLALSGELDSFWLIRSLRQRYPPMPILACGRDPDAREISRALFAGSDGYVDEAVDGDRLVRALRRVAEGEVVLEGLPGEVVLEDAPPRHRRYVGGLHGIRLEAPHELAPPRPEDGHLSI